MRDGTMYTKPVHYDLIHGPGPEELFAAHRWRNLSAHGTTTTIHGPATVKFTISDGVGHVPDEFVVDGLLWEDSDGPNIVRVTVKFFHNGEPRGERWSGEYNYRTHKGSLTSERGKEPLTTAGWDEATVEMLLARVTTVAELVALEEFQVCNLLLDRRTVEACGMSNELAGDAVTRFTALRRELNGRGLHFKGVRHTDEELFMMF